MDLGFMHQHRRVLSGRRPAFGSGPVDLDVLFAASAAEQAVTPTARMMAGEWRGGAVDPILVLARLMAPRGARTSDVAILGGCFNAPVAGILRWGKECEDDIYRGALADLQDADGYEMNKGRLAVEPLLR